LCVLEVCLRHDSKESLQQEVAELVVDQSWDCEACVDRED
jgi:hypothetical protein